MTSEPHSQQSDARLRHRRDQLAEEVAELHWNLGGLTYEMAIRDHFRLDVLIRRAAMLQERDAELAEVERMLHMQESGAAGNCPSCGAVRSRGAVFCWQCGAQVMERTAIDGNFGRQDSPDDRSAPTSPVAAPAARDSAFDRGREGIDEPAAARPIDAPAATHPLDAPAATRPLDAPAATRPIDERGARHPIDVLAGAPGREDRDTTIPLTEDLGRPVQTSS